MNLTENLVQEVQKVIVGKEDVIKNVLMAILAKGHILLEDIPGVGKTTLALAFSKALGMEYKRIQFTPDVIPSDVVGFSIYDKKTDSFVYKEGAVMCNLLLADEINRTSSKTQAALLEVME
ncbi:MAG: AAA family ATPase, partial [Blautia hydrogenotrophica]